MGVVGCDVAQCSGRPPKDDRQCGTVRVSNGPCTAGSPILTQQKQTDPLVAVALPRCVKRDHSVFDSTNQRRSSSDPPGCQGPLHAIPTLARADAASTASSLSIHPRLRTVTTEFGPRARRIATRRPSHRRSLRLANPARRASSRRLITRPGLASSTPRTDCSCSPRRYTRGLVCRSGRAGPAVAMSENLREAGFPVVWSV